MASRPDCPLPRRHRVRVEEIEPTSPYEKVAVDLRARILHGELLAGLPIPSFKQLAVEQQVSVSTVHRAVSLLKDWGLVELHSGRRTLVRQLRQSASASDAHAGHQHDTRSAVLLDLVIRRLGQVVARVKAEADDSGRAAYGAPSAALWITTQVIYSVTRLCRGVTHRGPVAAIRLVADRLPIMMITEVIVTATNPAPATKTAGPPQVSRTVPNAAGNASEATETT